MALKGRAFELSALQVLSNRGFELMHVGKRGDAGIDLRGRWNSAGLIPVVVQCKNYATGANLNPAVVRELEAVLDKEPEGTVGLLATPRLKYTAGLVSTLNSSRRPLFWTMIDDDKIIQFSLNNQASKIIPSLRVINQPHQALFFLDGEKV
jgi:hypothetical protein